MALEFLGEAVFTLLYDGVKQAIGKTGTFKYLLKDIKSTLESLNKLHATAIRQIGEYNLELGLPNDEIEELKEQMEEGAKLVGKLSDFRVWNYCCLSCYTDQLVDLDRSLKRLLENLKLQETRDVKEILDLLRKYRVELDQLKEMLQMLLQQRAGDVTETTSNSTAGSSTENIPQQSEGNGDKQGGADLRAVYTMLFEVVKEVKDKTLMFRPLLGDLKSMLDSLKPLIEEIDQYNSVLVLPKPEVEKFRTQMDKGVELVRKCSKVRPWTSYKKYNYTIRLIGLNESVRLLLSRLREQVAGEVSETLASISNLKEVIKQYEGPSVIQNQHEIIGSCKVPEPSSPTLMPEIEDSVEVHPLPVPPGAKLPSPKEVVEEVSETLASISNLKEVVKQYEGPSVIQNQHEIIGSCKVPESSSPTVMPEIEDSVEVHPLPVPPGAKLPSPKEVVEEVSETLASISNLKEVVKQYEGPSVIQNQHEIIGSCKVPESSSPTVMPEIEDSVEVHPLPVPPGAKLPSPKVLITTEPESQPMKGQWQKGKLIGRGTFGNVYDAFNGETGTLCAMKEVDFIPDDPKSAECMKQLQQEIKVLSWLKHPNIVQYYGTEIVGDRFLIYQEYVHPVSINRYVQEYCGAMTEAVVRSLTHQIVSGLAYLHSTETIHGDIKGDNLLVESSGVVKIADFGIAKHLQGRLLKGGPYWMAPEINENVILNDKCSDHDLARGGDIWSLGCTIIELLTGKPPWSELEQAQAMFLIVHRDPPIPETLSPEGKDFLTCCLQRNPAERPTAAMLLEHPFLKNSQPQDVPTMTGAINLVNLMDKHKMTELQSNLKEDLIIQKFSTDPSIHHCEMSLERGKEFSGGEGSSLGYSSPSPTDRHDQQQQPAATLSRHELQKRRDWNTFGQYLKNQRPPVLPSQCNYSHVLEFLRYLDQFGKTKVHLQGCMFYGQPEPPGPCTCPFRQAWGSLDALIGRLRAAYEENGGAPESSPFASGAIRGYLREVRECQAKARGIPYMKKKKKKPGNSDRDSSASSIMHFS